MRPLLSERQTMNDVQFNYWPIFVNMADRLMEADLIGIDKGEMISDMTPSEMIGVEQVLIDRVHGVDASIAKLGEVRVRANDIVWMIERTRQSMFSDDCVHEDE